MTAIPPRGWGYRGSSDGTPKASARGAAGVSTAHAERDRDVDDARYVVTTPHGFTEAFGPHEIDVLVRLGLIRHDYDGHLLQDGQGNDVGPLHHFYCESSRVTQGSGR